MSRRFLPPIWLAAALCFGSMEAFAAAVPVITDAQADLAYGQTAGLATLILQVGGLDAGELSAPQLITAISDVGTTPETVTVDLAKDVRELTPAGANSRVYLVTLQVNGLERGSRNSRWLKISAGGKDYLLTYILTNVPEAKFEWTVKAPPTIKVLPGQPIPISVVVGPVPATNLRVIASPVVERSTKKLLALKGMQICASSSKACTTEALNLPAGSSAELWLWGANGVGSFEGNVQIAADGKPQGDSIPLIIHSSTFCLRAAGVITILVSVLTAWLGTLVVRGRINRNLLLIPVAGIRDKLHELAAVIDADQGSKLPITATKITNLLEELSEAKLLAKGLPPPLQFTVAPAGGGSLDSFREHLKGVADWVNVLAIVVQEGLVPLRTSAVVAPQHAAVSQALATLDSIVATSTPPSPEVTRSKVQGLLQQMRNDISQGAAKGMPTDRPTAHTQHSLVVELVQLNLAAWALVLLGTTLTGAYILVLGPDTPGFGTGLDFLKCVLWGIGLPAGAQLMQQTSSTVQGTLTTTRT